jgi:NitT/TauT family transport system substrate-binding protein
MWTPTIITCLGGRAVAFLLGGLLAGAVVATKVEAQQKQDVTFGLPVATINSSYCMYPTAIRMGYFAAEGLNVRIQPIPGSTSVVQTVMSGRLQIGGATPEPVLKAIQDGGDLVMVYDYVRAPTGPIAVLADGPIKSLADLRGKKLGAQSLASGNILLANAILSKLNIDPKTEITYLSVGVGAQAYQALKNGYIDGLVFFDSLYAQLEGLGAKLRYFYGPGQDRLFSTQLVVKRSAVEKDADLIRGFGRAVAKATVVAQINPEACVKMLWKEIPASRVPGMSGQDQLKNDILILEKRLELMITPDVEKHGFGYYNADDVKAWNEFAVEGGIIKNKFENIDLLYTNKFVSDFNNFDRARIAQEAKEWRE